MAAVSSSTSCADVAAAISSSCGPAVAAASSSSGNVASAASAAAGATPPPPLPPPPIPPPPEPLREGFDDEPPRRRRRKGVDDPEVEAGIYWNVPGGRICFLKDELSAHCNHPPHKDTKNPCRLNRTIRPHAHSKYAQGRPLGYLLAWLEDQARHPHRTSHNRVRLQNTAEDLGAVSYERRLACRVKLGNRYPDLLAKERAAYPSEGPEPLTLA